jgi:lactobin A/cerein 7B family class IIb bacteriocin
VSFLKELTTEELMSIDGGGLGTDYISAVGGATGVGFAVGGPLGAALGAVGGATALGIAYMYDHDMV